MSFEKTPEIFLNEVKLTALYVVSLSCSAAETRKQNLPCDFHMRSTHKIHDSNEMLSRNDWMLTTYGVGLDPVHPTVGDTLV